MQDVDADVEVEGDCEANISDCCNDRAKCTKGEKAFLVKKKFDSTS